MVKAAVTLKGSATHMGRGRRIVRGDVLVVTDPADIRYYQTTAGFDVKILEGSMPKAPKLEDAPGEDSEPEPLKPEPAKPAYDRAELNKQPKARLVAIGKELGLTLATGLSKAVMVETIIDKQSHPDSDGESEDSDEADGDDELDDSDADDEPEDDKE